MHHLAHHYAQGAWACEPDALRAFLATVAAMPDDTMEEEDPKSYTVKNGVATINVSGILLRSVPAIFARFGINATGYDQLRSQIRAAEKDPAVAAVLFAVDSPGGSVAGVHGVADAIAGMTKPTAAHVSTLAASAGYWIASQTDSISAERGAAIGSIGVFRVAVDSSAAAAAEGIKVHLLASGPHKGAGQPGVAITPEQLAGMQSDVDSTAAEFVADVARGRGRAPTDILASADGRVYNTGDALARGLIDSIGESSMPSKTAVEQMAALIKAHPAHASLIADMASSDHSAEQIESAIVAADAKASADSAAAEIAALKARAEAAEKDAAESKAALESEKAARAEAEKKAEDLAKLQSGAPPVITPDAAAGSASVTAEQLEAMTPTARAEFFAKGGRVA